MADPSASHARLGQYEQELVALADRLINLIDAPPAATHVRRRTPGTKVLLEHAGEKPLDEHSILRAVADEARIELDRRHRADRGMKGSNQSIGYAATT